MVRTVWLPRLMVMAFLLSATVTLHAQVSSAGKYRRAKPPVFDPSKTSGIFFDDVFEQAVEGERPASLGAATSRPLAGGPAMPAEGDATPPAAAGGGKQWSKVIAATTIEDEIKAIKLKVDQSVSTPTQFRSRDYRVCRRYFTKLALLFAIIEEYDGEVRWKSAAPALRQAFGRAASNCKTGSDQAYNEAKLRKLDLQDVVGGATPNLPAAGPLEDWSQVCDRTPLMQILETSLQERLQPDAANQSSFQTNRDSLLREAQLVAAVGSVLKLDGMMDAGDEDYDGFCDSMTASAASLAEAIKANSSEQAGAAVSKIGQSCSSCHELYR